MFPQLFQRFLAARDTRTLNATIVLYPVVTTLLSFLTVSIGVMGRSVFPDLAPQETDAVYPLLLDRLVGGALAGLLLAGLPLWVWYYVALGLILALAYRAFLRREDGPRLRKERARAPPPEPSE